MSRRASRRRRAVCNRRCRRKPKRVLVPIADGTEEIEVVTVVDVLRRAGAEVVLASVEEEDRVVCSRGVKIEADCNIKAVTGRQGGKEGCSTVTCVRNHR